jgi:hypothetical protein
MSKFHIQEYVIPAQHIREYPGGTRTNQDDILKIAIKKYTPLEHGNDDLDGAVTIITANANGFSKV